jgi:hypothetical protein
LESEQIGIQQREQHSILAGRSGEARTPNPRFWSTRAAVLTSLRACRSVCSDDVFLRPPAILRLRQSELVRPGFPRFGTEVGTSNACSPAPPRRRNIRPISATPSAQARSPHAPPPRGRSAPRLGTHSPVGSWYLDQAPAESQVKTPL